MSDADCDSDKLSENSPQKKANDVRVELCEESNQNIASKRSPGPKQSPAHDLIVDTSITEAGRPQRVRRKTRKPDFLYTPVTPAKARDTESMADHEEAANDVRVELCEESNQNIAFKRSPGPKPSPAHDLMVDTSITEAGGPQRVRRKTRKPDFLYTPLTPAKARDTENMADHEEAMIVGDEASSESADPLEIDHTRVAPCLDWDSSTLDKEKAMQGVEANDVRVELCEESNQNIAFKRSPGPKPSPAHDLMVHTSITEAGGPQRVRRKTRKPDFLYTLVTPAKARDTESMADHEEAMIVGDEASSESADPLEIDHTRVAPCLDWDSSTLDKEKAMQGVDELETILLRLEMEKLLLEVDKLSEERQLITLKKRNIALRSDVFTLRDKLEGHAWAPLAKHVSSRANTQGVTCTRGTQTVDDDDDEAVCSSAVPTQTTSLQTGVLESNGSLLRSHLLHDDQGKSKKKRVSTKNIFEGANVMPTSGIHILCQNPTMPVFLPFERSPNMRESGIKQTPGVLVKSGKRKLTGTNHPSLFYRPGSARPVAMEFATEILSKQVSTLSSCRTKQTEVGSTTLHHPFSSVVHQRSSTELQVPTSVTNMPGLKLMGNNIVNSGVCNVPTIPQHAVVYSLVERNENETFILPTADVWGGTGQTATTSNSETNTHSVLGSGFAVVANPAQTQIVSDSDNTDIGKQVKNEINSTEEVGHETNYSYSIPMSPFCEAMQELVEQTDHDDGREAKMRRLSAPDNS